MSQVEELQTLLKIKTKEVESLQQSKPCPFAIVTEIHYLIIEMKSLQTTVDDKTAQTHELKTSSLVPQNSSGIISLPG